MFSVNIQNYLWWLESASVLNVHLVGHNTLKPGELLAEKLLMCWKIPSIRGEYLMSLVASGVVSRASMLFIVSQAASMPITVGALGSNSQTHSTPAASHRACPIIHWPRSLSRLTFNLTKRSWITDVSVAASIQLTWYKPRNSLCTANHLLPTLKIVRLALDLMHRWSHQPVLWEKVSVEYWWLYLRPISLTISLGMSGLV